MTEQKVRTRHIIHPANRTSQTKFKDHADRYVSFMAPKGRPFQTTRWGMLSAVWISLIPKLGQRELSTIDEQTIEEYQTELRITPRKRDGRPLSKNTILARVNLLRRIMAVNSLELEERARAANYEDGSSDKERRLTSIRNKWLSEADQFAEVWKRAQKGLTDELDSWRDWAQRQSIKAKQGHLAKYRVDKLREIGFDFDFDFRVMQPRSEHYHLSNMAAARELVEYYRAHGYYSQLTGESLYNWLKNMRKSHGKCGWKSCDEGSALEALAFLEENIKGFALKFTSRKADSARAKAMGSPIPPQGKGGGKNDD